MLNVPVEEVAAKDAKTYVDHIYDQVCEAMHAAVEYCRPTGKTRFNSNQNKKWWWNKDCLILRDRNKLFHHIWKTNGKPSNGVVSECYKASRKAYRNCCRKAINNRSLGKFKRKTQFYKDKKPREMWNLIL